MQQTILSKLSYPVISIWKGPLERANRRKKGKRYITKFGLIGTDVELHAQGQVKDPEDLVVFLRDLTIGRTRVFRFRGEI